MGVASDAAAVFAMWFYKGAIHMREFLILNFVRQDNLSMWVNHYSSVGVPD